MSEEKLEQGEEQGEDVEAHGGGGRGPALNDELLEVEAHGGGGRGPARADDDDDNDDVEAHRRRTS